MQKLVLFDIDGTLLYSTNKILRSRFSYALEKVYGVSPPIDWEEIEGHTDTTVFLSTLMDNGFTKDQVMEKLEIAFDSTYQHFAANVTADYKETILPGAQDLLENLKEDVHLGVLTGNIEKIAWHKLELVGLSEFFSFGLFGHEADDRPSLARLVMSKAKKHFKKNFAPKKIIFIGDTPKDIACAREIDATVISVATGKYTKEELLSFHPDLLVETLRDPKILSFIRKEQL